MPKNDLRGICFLLWCLPHGNKRYRIMYEIARHPLLLSVNPFLYLAQECIAEQPEGVVLATVVFEGGGQEGGGYVGATIPGEATA